MPCKQQSNIPTVYQTQFFAKLHKQNWLPFLIFIEHHLKETSIMMASLAKILVLLAIFFLASYANGFLSLSSATGTQVWINHLIWLEKPLSKPTADHTNDQTTKQLKLVALLPVNQSSKRVMCCDKGKDDEILSKLHNLSNTQPDWHGPNPIGMG
jgi:hypothetical protein